MIGIINSLMIKSVGRIKRLNLSVIVSPHFLSRLSFVMGFSNPDFLFAPMYFTFMICFFATSIDKKIVPLPFGVSKILINILEKERKES